MRVGQGEQRVVGAEGLGAVDVEERRGGRVFREELSEGVGVDHDASAGVDEDDGGLECGAEGGVDDAVVFGARVGVEGEDVGGGEEFVAGDGGRAPSAIGGDVEEVVVDDAGADGGGDSGDARSDAAEAEDAEGEFVDLARGVQGGAEVLPCGEVDGFEESRARAGVGEEEGEDELGDGVGVGVGGVDDADAASGAGGEVDVVETDAGAGDDAEVGGEGEEGGRRPLRRCGR